jgi:hypothetical protein
MQMFLEKKQIQYAPNDVLSPGKYAIPGSIPIVESPTPKDYLKALSQIYYHRGTITIIGNIVIGGLRWYEVQTDKVIGYVNSMALYGRQIIQIP